MKVKLSLSSLFSIITLSFLISMNLGANGCQNKNLVYVHASNKKLVPTGTEDNPFPTIQQGINVVNDGGKVIVFSGVYHENVIIQNKSIITLA